MALLTTSRFSYGQAISVILDNNGDGMNPFSVSPFGTGIAIADNGDVLVVGNGSSPRPQNSCFGTLNP